MSSAGAADVRGRPPTHPTPAETVPTSRLPATIGAGIVVGVLLVVMATSYSALVFSGGLEVHLRKGIALNLLGAVVGAVTVGLLTSLPWAIAGPQDVTGAILGVATASIAARMSPAADETFLTVVLVMALTSLLTGGCFLLLGSFHLGDLIRYVPYPVVGGFLAGTGWLLVKGGIGIMTGTPLSWANISSYGRSGTASKCALVTIFAAFVVWAARRYRHPLIVPAALGGVVVAFYLALLGSGASLNEAEAGGWLLGPFREGDAWRPWALEAVGGADWGAVRSQIPTLAGAVVVGVLALLLNASGIEIAVDRDVDLNRELRAAGTANVLIGAVGAMPGYQKVSATVLADALGARTRHVALVAAVVCGIALVAGASALSLFPRLALGGLVAYLGLNLLLEWVHDAWFRLRSAEYALVLTILLVIAGLGFLAGVVAGTVVALMLFAVDSSRAEVITAEHSGSAILSNVDRGPAAQAVISARADAIHIVRLQGFLFFGTAHRLVHRVRERAEHASPAPLEFLVLDFKRVTGVDSSATVSFVRMTRLARAKNFRIVLTGVSPHVDRQLSRGAHAAADLTRILPDLDRGVQWCEDQILAERVDAGACAAEPEELLDLRDGPVPGERLAAYLEEMELPAGHVLIREGDRSDDLFLLQSGQLTSLMEGPGGEAVRLRTMGPGAIVGEIGLYCGRRRTASVVADAPSRVLRLAKRSLEIMERRDPEAAAELHRMVAGLLAERLAMVLQTQRAYMD